MKNLSNLNTKDKMLILKAIAKIAQNTYDDNTTFILNQVLKEGTKENEFGQFSKRHYNAKTVIAIIKEKEDKMAKLKQEIIDLRTLPEDTIMTEAYDTLVGSYTNAAEEEAKALLKDLIKDLDSKRLTNSFNKVVASKTIKNKGGR